MICCRRRGLYREELSRAFNITPTAAPDMADWLILVAQFDKESPVRPDPTLPALCALPSQRIFLDKATGFPDNLGEILNGRVSRQSSNACLF